MKDYLFVKPLGAGTYGAVDLYQHKQDKTFIAVKKLSPKYVQRHEIDAIDPSVIKEVTTLSRIKGIPHTLQMLRVFVDIKNDYLDTSIILPCYELTLYEFANKIPTMMERINLLPVMLQQLGQALFCLNNRGIIHNDIKGDNIMVRTKSSTFRTETYDLISKPDLTKLEGLEFCFVDFGLSEQLNCSYNFINTYTKNRLAVTPGYRAPELIAEMDHNITVDLWALAVTFLKFLIYPITYKIDVEKRVFGPEKLTPIQILRKYSIIIDKGLEVEPFLQTYLNSREIEVLRENGIFDFFVDIFVYNPAIRPRIDQLSLDFIPCNKTKDKAFQKDFSIRHLDEKNSQLYENSWLYSIISVLGNLDMKKLFEFEIEEKSTSKVFALGVDLSLRFITNIDIVRVYQIDKSLSTGPKSLLHTVLLIFLSGYCLAAKFYDYLFDITKFLIPLVNKVRIDVISHRTFPVYGILRQLKARDVKQEILQYMRDIWIASDFILYRCSLDSYFSYCKSYSEIEILAMFSILCGLENPLMKQHLTVYSYEDYITVLIGINQRDDLIDLRPEFEAVRRSNRVSIDIEDFDEVIEQFREYFQNQILQGFPNVSTRIVMVRHDDETVKIEIGKDAYYFQGNYVQILQKIVRNKKRIIILESF